MTETESAAAPQPGPVGVLLVDDHAIWRGGVRSMLEDTEFEVVGEASSRNEAIEAARRLKPRLVLLDIRMAGGDGLEALHMLKEENPGMAVVMLTTYDNPTYFARAVAGGAAGYLLKGVDRDELVAALRAVAGGELLIAPEELVASLRGVSESASTSKDLYEPLTERELEVLRLLSTGLKNRDIATVLFVAESTVKTHVEHIMRKLGVSDRVQAAVWAARHGLVKPDGGRNAE
ncbi:MAG TPA: response regulator transcription factor [Armatimonadota bacterium]|nr:response regulator transcription factor [Armatimonadota bacterium]